MSKEIQLSLTKENSHTISIPLGQGSLAIGTIGMNKKHFDVLVEENAPINWDTFNTCFTSAGREKKEHYPYGDWPRFIYYSGNDLGFIKWTAKRKTEDFSWTPQKSIIADFTKVNIRNLSIIQSKSIKIGLKLGKNITSFSISGNLENIDILLNEGINSLSVYPDVSKNEIYQLPKFDKLKDITSLSISIKPLDNPIDCRSLLQFKNLTSLSLSGNFTNLDCLKDFEKIERLAIRYAPNLENFPKLDSWKKLNHFIGWNIEETKGKQLRKELNNLSKERKKFKLECRIASDTALLAALV